MRPPSTSVEWFDFGHISDGTLFDAFEVAEDFMNERLVRPPYPEAIFKYKSDEQLADVLFYMLGYDDKMVVQMHAVAGSIVTEPMLYFQINYDPAKAVAGWNINPKLPSWLNAHNTADDILRVFYGLWMILNTSGVEVHRHIPDAKLQARRAKDGKPPATAYTTVNAKRYVDAADEAARMEKHGKSTSPRPHLRRGHIRRLTDDRKVMVRPCIINAKDGMPMPRAGYRVETASI